MAELGAAAIGHELFSYNRENYQYDREQQQKRDLAAQNMRIKQFSLYREDVRDLVGLTVNKMDNYMVINVLLLGFPIILFTEGRPHTPWTPAWLLWLFELNNAGAFVYFLLSMWLALHASISAHAFGVRLLTQYIRLPIPNKKQLDAAQFRLQDYEGVSVQTMFRIPVFQQMTRTVNNMNMTTTEEADEAIKFAPIDEVDDMLSTPAAMLKHVQLFRQVQQNWQAYDGYARVCMTMGMLEMLLSLSFYCLNSYIIENDQTVAALVCVLTMTYAGWLIWRLDIYTTRANLMLSGVLFFLPPALCSVPVVLWKHHLVHPQEEGASTFEHIFVPFAFAANAIWLSWMLWAGFAGGQLDVCVPTRFRAVLYLDVYGFFGREAKGQSASEQTEATFQATSRAADVNLAHQDEPIVATELSDVIDTANANQAEAVATNLRKTLSDVCWKLHRESDEVLSLWELDSLQDLLKSDPNSGHLMATIAGLRRMHGRTLLALREIDAESEKDLPARADDDIVWLEIDWVREGQTWMYYFNSQTAAVVWTKPTDHVSTLGAVDKTLHNLKEQVAKFVNFINPPAQADPATPWTMEQSFLVGSEEDEQSLRSKVQLIDRGLTTSVTKAVEMLNKGVIQCDSGICVVFSSSSQGYYCLFKVGNRDEAKAKLPEKKQTEAERVGLRSQGSMQIAGRIGTVSSFGSNASSGGMSGVAENLRQPLVGAQETRYGGREAVELTRGHTEQFFGHSGQAGGTYFPTQQLESGNRPKRLPGQMPWRTFLYGTSVLIALWIVGTVVVILEQADVFHIQWGDEAGGHGSQVLRTAVERVLRPEMRHTPRLLYDGAWPHAFFTPRDIACHASFGQSIFILEKYAVYQLSLSGKPIVIPALAACLKEDPEFHYNGFRSMSVQCTANSTCYALLFSDSGLGVLRCPLSSDVQISAQRLRVRGNKLRSFASSDDGGAWALRDRNALVRLGQHSVHANELVPQYEAMTDERLAKVNVMHALQDRKLLGLDPEGWLYSWSVSSNGATYVLPVLRHLSIKWTGLCSIDSTLYFAGIDKSGAAAVWRMKPQDYVSTSVLV